MKTSSLEHIIAPVCYRRMEQKEDQLSQNLPKKKIRVVNPLIPDYILYELTIETSKIIASRNDELSQIRWTDGEANLDSAYSVLACTCCEMAWSKIQQKYQEYVNVSITACSPDINIQLWRDGKPFQKGRIELKSGKGKIIPGGCIGSLNMNQPIIFCKRNENVNPVTFEVRYGIYGECIGDTEYDLFQDRTPRPHVNFQKLSPVTEEHEFKKFKSKDSWAEHYAKCASNRVENPSKVRVSWQDTLTKEIQNIAIERFLRNTSIEEIQRQQQELLSKDSSP